MLKYFRYSSEALSKLTHNASVSPEEKIRFQHFTVFLALGIPTMVAYGLYNLVASHYLLCVLILLSAMGLVLGWFSLMHLKNGRNVYRINIVLFAGLLLYMVFTGGEEGEKILWMYTCPLILFFLLGKKEGLFWSIVLIFLAVIILLNPFSFSGAYDYSDQFTIRFVSTYLIVSAITYWFEYFRHQYRVEIENKNTTLQLEIIERKKVEEQLKESQNQLRSWLEHSPVCTKILDHDFYLQYMSSAGKNALRIGGIEEFHGKKYPFQCYPEPTRSRMVQTLEKIRKTGEIAALETPVFDADGNQLWFNSTFVPVPNKNNPCDYVLIVSVNITDQKTAEEKHHQLELQLQHTKKMEAIGTLAGGIAHDFNNILSVILGYTEMARDDSQPGSDVVENLSKVLEAGNRAKDLVKQILAFSRQEKIKHTAFQPASIVLETLKMLRPTIPTTITINPDIDSKTGLLFADPTQFNQILMNLCTNAFQAMELTGGNLDIILKETNLNSDDLRHEQNLNSGTYIKLSVIDSGHGIPQSVKTNIFDPYFTTKKVGKGSGMGLSIIYGIVKSSGGFITFESDPDKGTAFHVFLPVAKEKVTSKNEIADKTSGGSERILFIDDEEILAELGKELLERLGYQVTVKINSFEALKTFQHQYDQFDLVITDQTMPGINGTDLSRKMLQIRPDIPIILCTGFSTTISEKEAKFMGIKEFALKPVTTKEISRLIKKVLEPYPSRGH